jgi:TolB-like protein/tetratricopeptide (TPR) repeat protein
MSFLAELKRRNVIRMAGLYLVGAWLVTQVAATLLPVFGAPEWVMKVLVGLLALGFLAALVFSWIYELTPDGLKRDSEVGAAQSIAPQTARRMDRMIIVVLLLALGYFGYDKFVLAPGRVASTSVVANDASAPEAEASIAVLPFVNMSTDVENGFFADGISEELLNVLAGIDGLKVASRTSAFSFKGKDTPIPEIARQLDVRHVLEGSVRKQGQRVRITAQLIHAGTDGHLWSETFDRDLTDIFKVQEEIAQAIAGELEGILGKRQVAVPTATANIDAYQSFLRGRARFHAREDLLAAIDDLASAVRQDPDFADAWVYLAATWGVAPGYLSSAEVDADRAQKEARSALERAQALAPEHPMALAIRSQFREQEGDLIGALKLLETSAALSTQDSNPMMWRGTLLLRSGYIDEAVAVLESAQKQDPLAGINNGYLAFAQLSAGQNERAEASARRAWSQGWRVAFPVIVYDLAARGERERAVALRDEFFTPNVATEFAERNAAWKELLRNPGSKALDAMNFDPVAADIESGIAINRLDRMLEVAEERRKQSPDGPPWWLRSAWLPSTLALREHPRFFALAEDLGMVGLWETRGYPPGCQRVSAPGGDHLDCAGQVALYSGKPQEARP